MGHLEQTTATNLSTPLAGMVQSAQDQFIVSETIKAVETAVMETSVFRGYHRLGYWAGSHSRPAISLRTCLRTANSLRTGLRTWPLPALT